MIEPVTSKDKLQIGSWQPQPGPQTEALRRNEKEILYGGARFGGKSVAGMAWLCEPEYISNPQYQSLIIRKDYDDLADWIHRARFFYGDLCEIVGNPSVIKWKAGGVTRVGHWKDKTTISKYLGHEYQKMLFEELTQGVSSFEEYQMLLGSCRSTVEGLRAQVFCTTNPGGGGHRWVKEYFVDKANCKAYQDPDTGYWRIFIPARATDNKIGLAKDPEYARWLSGLQGVLGAMWRDGSWEVFEGQFFSQIGDEEKSFDIQQSDLEGRLFGSLDGGTTHNTSFGLWWVDRNYRIHRLFTYCNNGGTHREHAQEIFDRLESFAFTKGYFPEIVVADPALWTKVKLNENMVRAPIDEYIDLFRDRVRKTRFEKANNNKTNGCQLMKMLFRGENGMSDVRYWPEHNRSYVDALNLAMSDKNDPEIYAKMDGDDPVDESRYGLVHCYSFISNIKQHTKAIKEPSPVDRLMRGDRQRNSTLVGKDWYSI